MEKKLSELTPHELMKLRIKTATYFALGLTLGKIIFLPEKNVYAVFIQIVGGIFLWIGWFFLFHRLAIWSENKFAKNK